MRTLPVDPLTSQRAPFVAKALIALAGYVRAGVKAIDLPPNPRRAADYLHHAAVFFGDRDAQLELARAYLGADSPSDDVRRGLHYLASLAEESHGPAQAVLAELFWRGRHVAKDDRRALALVTIAVENAPQHERIWIEEGYAAIFCAAAQPVREAASGLASRWRKMFAEPAPVPAASLGLGARDLVLERQCANGEDGGHRAACRSPVDQRPALQGGGDGCSFQNWAAAQSCAIEERHAPRRLPRRGHPGGSREEVGCNRASARIAPICVEAGRLG